MFVFLLRFSVVYHLYWPYLPSTDPKSPVQSSPELSAPCLCLPHSFTQYTLVQTDGQTSSPSLLPKRLSLIDAGSTVSVQPGIYFWYFTIT